MIKIFRNFDPKNPKKKLDFEKKKNDFEKTKNKIEYDMNQLFNKLQRNGKHMELNNFSLFGNFWIKK